MDPLIGAEYGSWFELRDKKLTLVPETQGEADFSFELDATEGPGLSYLYHARRPPPSVAAATLWLTTAPCACLFVQLWATTGTSRRR